MPKKGEPCEMCRKPTKRGVPSPFGSDCGCEMEFLACIQKWRREHPEPGKVQTVRDRVGF